MGITGNSYGGYMSCAAITFAPEVFQAAIPRSGGYCNRVGFRQDGELRHIKQVEYYFPATSRRTEGGLLPELSVLPHRQHPVPPPS